jgi:methanogenic corrinoid protein MtbC1
MPGARLQTNSGTRASPRHDVRRHGGILAAPSDRGRRERVKATVASGGSQKSDQELKCVIEGEIIPRLLLAHAAGFSDGVAMADATIAPVEDAAERIARIAVQNDVDSAEGVIRSLIERGMPIDRIFLDVLAPAARRLGELWETDDLDFVDVTIGLSRMQQIVRRLSPPGQRLHPVDHNGYRILLSLGPGEQHGFGLMLIEEAFRRAGWGVWGGVAITPDEVVELVEAQHFDAIGLSLSCERLLDGLGSFIERLREAAHPAQPIVLVGGRIFNEDPDAVHLVGADASAKDAHEAVRLAEARLQRSLGGTA